MPNLIKKSTKHIVRILPLQKFHAISESWNKAAGIANKKKKSLEKHLKTIRKDWHNDC